MEIGLIKRKSRLEEQIPIMNIRHPDWDLQYPGLNSNVLKPKKAISVFAKKISETYAVNY